MGYLDSYGYGSSTHVDCGLWIPLLRCSFSFSFGASFRVLSAGRVALPHICREGEGWMSWSCICMNGAVTVYCCCCCLLFVVCCLLFVVCCLWWWWWYWVRNAWGSRLGFWGRGDRGAVAGGVWGSLFYFSCYEEGIGRGFCGRYVDIFYRAGRRFFFGRKCECLLMQSRGDVMRGVDGGRGMWRYVPERSLGMTKALWGFEMSCIFGCWGGWVAGWLGLVVVIERLFLFLCSGWCRGACERLEMIMNGQRGTEIDFRKNGYERRMWKRFHSPGRWWVSCNLFLTIRYNLIMGPGFSTHLSTPQPSPVICIISTASIFVLFILVQPYH